MDPLNSKKGVDRLKTSLTVYTLVSNRDTYPSIHQGIYKTKSIQLKCEFKIVLTPHCARFWKYMGQTLTSIGYWKANWINF